MFLSDGQKAIIRETAGIRNIDMLKQLPRSISSTQSFVRLGEVRVLVAVRTLDGMLTTPPTSSFHRMCVLLSYEGVI
jgi:hypothetical protein